MMHFAPNKLLEHMITRLHALYRAASSCRRSAPRWASKRRHIVSFVISLLLAASAHADSWPPAHDEITLDKKKVDTTYALKKMGHKKRLDESAELRTLLPKKGLVLFSGGFVSVARRLSLDLSTGILKYGSSTRGGSSFGPMTVEGSQELTSDQIARVVSLANVIWFSEKDFTRFPPIADFDVRLVLCDGDDIKNLSSYGPPKDEIDQLYTLLWNLVSRQKQGANGK